MTRPDVLLIITDEHRFDCLGATGNVDLETPALDGLAGQGTMYENAFCTYPVCAPSRYSIVTGLYAHQHGGIGNAGSIRQESRTFPELLRERGYRTAAVGKMHLTPTYADIGFDRMILSEQHGDGRYIDDYHRHLYETGVLDELDVTDQVAGYRRLAPRSYWDRFGAFRSTLPEEHHSTTWTGDRAVEEISRWEPDEPNLLTVSFIKPHHPFDPPAPWDRLYEPDGLRLLPGWTEECLARDLDRDGGYFPHPSLSAEALRRVMAHYYGTISQIDRQVGRIIDRLRACGRYENTMIVFTSDHGEYLGFHHLLLKGGHLYDPLARIPMIIKYPDREGERDPRLVSHLDLAPTILRCTGAEPHPAMPGSDLADRGWNREYVVAESLGDDAEFMVRSSRFKLLQGDRPDATLFFDLRNDPLELTDVSAAPELRAELHRHREALSAVVDPAAVHSGHTSTDRVQITGANVPADIESLGGQLRDWVGERMRRPGAGGVLDADDG